MKLSDLKCLSLDVDTRANEVMWSKNKDYTQDNNDDAMSNLRNLGKELEEEGVVMPGKGMQVVAWVYFRKHLEALRSFHFDVSSESEAPVQRVVDLINYEKFMLAMWMERHEDSSIYAGVDMYDDNPF